MEALHALADGAQVDHVLVLHGFLAGSQALLEAVRSWKEKEWGGGREGAGGVHKNKTKQTHKKKGEQSR